MPAVSFKNTFPVLAKENFPFLRFLRFTAVQYAIHSAGLHALKIRLVNLSSDTEGYDYKNYKTANIKAIPNMREIAMTDLTKY